MTLQDGRIISEPLTPTLKRASPAQRARWRIEGSGTGIYWPDIDEDILVAHVLGIPEDELYDFAGFSSEQPALTQRTRPGERDSRAALP